MRCPLVTRCLRVHGPWRTSARGSRIGGLFQAPETNLPALAGRSGGSGEPRVLQRGSALARAARAAATGTATTARTAAATGATTAAGTPASTVAGRAVAGVAARAAILARRGVVGREVHRVARMAVGTRGLARTLAGACTGATGAAGTRTAADGLAARTRLAAGTGVAMAAGAGADALRHVPGAERGRIAIRQRLQHAFLLALLERLLRLLGRHLAADGQAAVRLLAAAAAATVLADMVETAQFAALVGGVVAVDVGLATLADAHRGLGRATLADHRLQGQGGSGGVIELELRAQRLDLLLRQLLRLAAQQFTRQADLAVAHALEAADLAALRFPQAAHFAVAAFLDHDLEPVMGVGAADALDLVELRRAVLERHAAGEAVDDVVRHAFLALRGAHPHHVLALDLVRRMHHRVGDLAVGGQQQQAGGVDVQPADGDPA